jgi:hypothetical protein
VSVSNGMVLQCVDTSLGYMGQRGFKYSDITPTRNICTSMRSLNSLKKQVTINSFSK